MWLTGSVVRPPILTFTHINNLKLHILTRLQLVLVFAEFGTSPLLPILPIPFPFVYLLLLYLDRLCSQYVPLPIKLN